MSSSKFNTISEHISYSEEVYTDIKETGENVIKKIKSLDSKTSDEMILTVLNQAVENISNIIYSLQKIVIKSNVEKSSNFNLKIVVKKLSQDCNDLVQEFDSDHTVIKPKFEAFVQNLYHEAEGLFNLIQKDELHEYKHELVEALKEILCTILRIQIRIDIQNFSLQQLKITSKEVLQQFNKELDTIKNADHGEVLKNMAIHVRHGSNHAFEVAYYLNQVASNYDGEIQHEILKAAYSLNIANVDFLLNLERSKSIQEAIASLKVDCVKCWGAVENLLEYINNKVENKEAASNLKDLVRDVVSFGIAITIQSGKSIRRSCS